MSRHVTSYHRESQVRAESYANRRRKRLKQCFGWGYDGIVFETDSDTAIKALRYRDLYERERDVYIRLQDRAVENVLGFSIPKLVSFDNELWVVEMGIVSPPCVLDFAGAYVDRNPFDFSDDQLTEWENEKREQFEERWPLVRQVVAVFRKYGVYLSDINPGNIKFGIDTT